MAPNCEHAPQQFSLPTDVVFVCNAYHIGKERCYFGFALANNFRVWASPARAKTLRRLDLPKEWIDLLVTSQAKCDVIISDRGVAPPQLQALEEQLLRPVVGFQCTGAHRCRCLHSVFVLCTVGFVYAHVRAALSALSFPDPLEALPPATRTCALATVGCAVQAGALQEAACAGASRTVPSATASHTASTRRGTTCARACVHSGPSASCAPPHFDCINMLGSDSCVFQ
jgi:hypothetical protein